MNYTYLLEKHTNQCITISDLYNTNKKQNNILYILCYHITYEAKYPFIQFLMDKIPFCNYIVEEKFALPYIIYSDKSLTLEELVLDRVKVGLTNMNYDIGTLQNSVYKGVVYDQNETPYALVNISTLNILGLQLQRDNLSWFVLPSEIINNKKVCNIAVDEQVVDLFNTMPTLALLTNIDTNEPIILPDVVYTGNELKTAQFHSLFGVSKMKEYQHSGKYYYFYRSLDEVLREGGWVKNGGISKIDKGNILLTHNASGRLLVDNDYGRYINGGIVRYALFTEGKVHIEPQNTFSLSDDIINTLYPESCIIIGYSGEHEIKSDVLVKEYNSFMPLSYHRLDKRELGDKYDQKKYIDHNIIVIE